MSHPADDPCIVPNRTPRILIVTRNLPPLIGGMEQLNWHVARELSRNHEVRLIGPEGSAALAPQGVNVIEASTAKMAPFLWRAFFMGIRVARAWRPNIILAGSGLTAPIAVIAAKLAGARSAVYAHGLDLSVDHAVYRNVWLPLIARADTVLVNSSATRRLAAAAGVAESRIRLIPPGTTVPGSATSSKAQDAAAAFQGKHGLQNAKVLISVGRLTQRKGILEFVRDVLPAIVARFPQCKLVVVGAAPTQALAANGQSVDQILAEAERAGVAANLCFVGTISDRDQLSGAYWSADLHVFPVRELPNDPEGFGMVAIEAAAHGVATVAYRTGGVPDAVAHGRSGRLVDTGDSVSFARAAIELLENPLPPAEVVDFARRFAWDQIGRELREALDLG